MLILMWASGRWEDLPHDIAAQNQHLLVAIEDLHFHDFRHAFVSRAILAGVPPAVALKASGHASDEWKRYLNMTPDQLQNLFKPLGEQTKEEVQQYGLNILRQLRDALGYSQIAGLLGALDAQK